MNDASCSPQAPPVAVLFPQHNHRFDRPSCSCSVHVGHLCGYDSGLIATSSLTLPATAKPVPRPPLCSHRADRHRGHAAKGHYRPTTCPSAGGRAPPCALCWAGKEESPFGSFDGRRPEVGSNVFDHYDDRCARDTSVPDCYSTPQPLPRYRRDDVHIDRRSPASTGTARPSTILGDAETHCAATTAWFAAPLSLHRAARVSPSPRGLFFFNPSPGNAASPLAACTNLRQARILVTRSPSSRRNRTKIKPANSRDWHVYPKYLSPCALMPSQCSWGGGGVR